MSRKRPGKKERDRDTQAAEAGLHRTLAAATLHMAKHPPRSWKQVASEVRDVRSKSKRDISKLHEELKAASEAVDAVATIPAFLKGEDALDHRLDPIIIVAAQTVKSLPDAPAIAAEIERDVADADKALQSASYELNRFEMATAVTAANKTAGYYKAYAEAESSEPDDVIAFERMAKNAESLVCWQELDIMQKFLNPTLRWRVRSILRPAAKKSYARAI